VVLGLAPGLYGGDGAPRGLGKGDGRRGQDPDGGLPADGVQARLPDGFAGGLLRFPVQAEPVQELSGLDQEGRLAEARVGGQRRRLSIIELADGYEQVDQRRGRLKIPPTLQNMNDSCRRGWIQLKYCPSGSGPLPNCAY
jgi:hypothetical protein